MIKRTHIISFLCVISAAISLFVLFNVSLRNGQSIDEQLAASHSDVNSINGLSAGLAAGKNAFASANDVNISGDSNSLASKNKNKTGGGENDISASSSSLANKTGLQAQGLSSGSGGYSAGQINSQDSQLQETEQKPPEENPENLYAGNPEARGQDGKLLPSPDKVLEGKAKDILKYYENRKAKDVVIESEIEISDQGVETELRPQPDPAQQPQPDEQELLEQSVDEIAQQNANEDEADVDKALQVEKLLEAAAEDKPVETRLKALHLLSDIEPDLVETFLEDKDELIRSEAERLVGILPEQ